MYIMEVNIMNGLITILLIWVVYGFGILLDLTGMMLDAPYAISFYWLGHYPGSYAWSWLTSHLFHMDFMHIMGNSIYMLIGWLLMHRTLIYSNMAMFMLLILIPGFMGLFPMYGIGASAIAKGMVAAGVIGLSRKLCLNSCYLIPLMLWVVMGDLLLIIGQDFQGIGVFAHLMGVLIGTLIGVIFSQKKEPLDKTTCQ